MIILLLALSLLDLWHRISRDTSSHAANLQGAKHFASKHYPEAEGSFAKASTIAPTPPAAFNLGTAQIAAGHREEGSHTLQNAMSDPALRADSLYNRGNSALAAGALDHAARDYSDALRLRPGDAAAKRNLEIALTRKRASQPREGGASPDRQNGSKKPQAQPAPGTGPKDALRPKSDPNTEALLRSVQQQEQEELRRMRRLRQEPVRIGW